MHARRIAPTDVPLPAWVEDPADKITLARRPWSARPVVNFIGQAYPLGAEFSSVPEAWLKWVKATARAGLTAAKFAGLVGVPEYHFHRTAAVLALGHTSLLDARIVLRPGPTRLDQARPNDASRQLEFLTAIAGSDYTLAPRGDGNYSHRLYESLACGRPAIIVESGMPLPRARKLPWDDLVIRLKAHQLLRIGPHIRRRHEMAPCRWEEVQASCRSVWKEQLSATGFFTALVGNLTASLDEGVADAVSLAAALR
jgi:hypothetical protein